MSPEGQVGSGASVARAQIVAQIATILRDRLQLEASFDAETDLAADLQLDSVQLLTLIVELENSFQICFDDGDEQGIGRMGDLVALIERRVGDRDGARHGSQDVL